MAIEGTLDAFALPDVLGLLAVTAKTGYLCVEGDRGRGGLWVYEGALVAATADRAIETMSIDEVMFELLRFEQGSFRFTADELSVDEGRRLEEIESTLQRAGQLLEEWHSLEGVVPSLTHRVALVRELASEQVTLDARLWPALVAIASCRSVDELARALGLGELNVGRLVKDLVDAGVAFVEPPGTEPTRSPDRLLTTGELTAAR